VAVAAASFHELDEVFRIKSNRIADGDKIVLLQFLMRDGIGRAKRYAMTAEVAVILIGVHRYRIPFVGETTDASDGTETASITFFLIDRYPIHEFLPIYQNSYPYRWCKGSFSNNIK